MLELGRRRSGALPAKLDMLVWIEPDRVASVGCVESKNMLVALALVAWRVKLKVVIQRFRKGQKLKPRLFPRFAQRGRFKLLVLIDASGHGLPIAPSC